MARASELDPANLEVGGPLDRRLELAINLDTDAVLIAMVERLAGGTARNARSKAARKLLAAGAASIPGLLAEAGRVAVRLRKEEAERAVLAEAEETSHSG